MMIKYEHADSGLEERRVSSLVEEVISDWNEATGQLQSLSVQDKKAESLNQSAIQQKVPKGALRAEVKIEGQGGSAKSG